MQLSDWLAERHDALQPGSSLQPTDKQQDVLEFGHCDVSSMYV